MSVRKTTPGLNRRRFLAASAAGLGAAGLTATGAVAASASPASLGQPGSSLAEAVLVAFRTHRVVAIGKAHAAQETGDQLLTLLSDPRLYGVVNDIVVEFGDAFYQDTLDKFVLDGHPIFILCSGLRLQPPVLQVGYRCSSCQRGSVFRRRRHS